MGLEKYHHKRDFKKTSEPKGRVHKRDKHRFYLQKHAASHLHYDFRLELNGILKSWAIPKGPSLDPTVKRLAIHVEDHPIEYGMFEGIIPKGEYGGGTVMLWDKGTWNSLDDDIEKAYKKGHLRFELDAKKLAGRWDLIQFKKQDNAWFLIKFQDEFARDSTYDITVDKPDSVLSQQSIEEISDNHTQVWSHHALVQADTTQTQFVKAKKKYKELVKTEMPESLSPQLATLVDKPPNSAEWLHEVKFDGYRILGFKQGKKVWLLSRTKKNWTTAFASIAESIEHLAIENVILDGELVLLDEYSRSNFQLLQNAIKDNSNAPFVYYVFDVLYYKDRDIRKLPLLERKRLLQPLLTSKTPNIIYSDHIIGHGNDVFKQKCTLSLEGIISKKIESNYSSGRSKSWVKVKCIKRQEFVIGGYTKPKQSGKYFGSLFLGVYTATGEFLFAGNVGTGFTDSSLKELHTLLQKHIVPSNPFSTIPPGSKSATWVKPELVVEIEFNEWTSEGRLRHPSFKGVRHDKKPNQVIRETKQPIETISKIKPKSVKQTITNTLTHPYKVLYPEDGITKQDLLNYYKSVAPYILPYIKERPLTLVRCPNEYTDCFYQKKLGAHPLPGVFPLAISTKNTKEPENYIYIKDETGLFSLVQMGCLEIHPWGSRYSNLEYPDIMVIDLDPAPEIEWKQVVEAAFDVKRHLEQFELRSFVKTTGGKGLHVVVPLLPDYNWDDLKQFSHVFAEFLYQTYPDKYVINMSNAKRKGKIFIDYLRNQRGATAIAPYSTRARPHAPVSTPIAWDELTTDINDTRYTIRNLPKRLAELKNDPWASFWTIRQSIRLKDYKSEPM